MYLLHMAAAKAQMHSLDRVFTAYFNTKSSQASARHDLAIWIQPVCKGDMFKSFEFTYMSWDMSILSCETVLKVPCQHCYSIIELGVSQTVITHSRIWPL